MKVHLFGDRHAGVFSSHLLLLGNGTATPDSDGLIDKKRIGTVVNSEEELLRSVFPDMAQKFCNQQWLCERAVLAPLNVSIRDIKFKMFQQIPGAVQVYKSIDTVPDASVAVQYPVEFLNSLELPGIPSYRLELKIGAPIILLHNLDTPKLCNGAKLAGKQLLPHVIEATIIAGASRGENVFIPRIPIMPADLPFEFKRLQFPVKLRFAMSINKAQGQSLKGDRPQLLHGQLYVGCSRVSSPRNLFILAPDGKTSNIVYTETLTR